MDNKDAGGMAPYKAVRRILLRANSPKRERKGVILLAVLVFVALLLPLVTLVLTSINTEAVATAEVVKGAKSELAAEKAINDAISLVVHEKNLPNYWVSVNQPSTAVIVHDANSGFRRDQIPGGSGNGATGQDDILGTEDDYWIGPRHDGSYIGTTDDFVSDRMYRYDFRFTNQHAPTYIGQGWSRSTDNLDYARSIFSGSWQFLLNQYAAETLNDDNADLLWDGYDLTNLDPFINAADSNEPAILSGPGYYRGSDEPRTAGAGSPVNRILDAGSNNVRDYMFNSKVNLYESIYSDYDLGPMPTSLLKSYANVTDEAGRLNLNIFCKKVRVRMPESAETDYDFDGYGTNDFNDNGLLDEVGWKWMDNPLFPDRLSTLKQQFNPVTGTFTPTDPIDWGSFDPTTGTFSNNDDGLALPEIGENVQHYYAGDNDGDGIPESIDACQNSLNMLMALPGVDGQLAANILTYMNPSQDYFAALAADRGQVPDYYIPGSGGFTDYVDVPNDVLREDACNITPPMIALELSVNAFGQVDDFYWNFNLDDDSSGDSEDDLPLPPPRPLTSVDQLRDVPGMTQARFELLKDYVTVSSYDTNLIATGIQDVSPDADLENAYVPGDPEYNGSVVRPVPDELRDTDDIADLRFDMGRFVFGFNLSEYREAAEEMYAHARAHLPRTNMLKTTLPVVDRYGRTTPFDSYVPNDDARYILASGGLLVPHRQDGNLTEQHPYNVGEFGHQEDINIGGSTLHGAGYPALNPEFSLDSCISIIMYRNGTYFEEDDYSYNPQGGNIPAGPWYGFAKRIPVNFFPWGSPLFARLLGPFASLLQQWMEPNNNPDPNLGYNANPAVRAHGHGAFTMENLVNYGEFDSVADSLNVPLYEYKNLSVSLMADPPSSYRLDDGDGNINGGDPAELDAVNYYISFSDVVDAGWYLEHISGPDGIQGTGDDPAQDIPLYRLNFTIANRPGATTDINPANWDAELDITALQLRLAGANPTDSGNAKVTIVAHDNVNNLPILGPQYNGNFGQIFGWDDVPEPEDPPFSDGDGRPIEAGYWNNAGNSAQRFANAADRQAWAFDNYGHPYLTARAEVVRLDPDSALPIIDQVNDPRYERADDICKVYLQYNQAARVPFRVDTMAIRVSGDEYEIRSAVGGQRTDGGAFVLYDWELNGDPADPDTTSHDGTWPSQGWQFGDPRVIRVTPQAANIVLHAYDMRAFYDDDAGLPFPTQYLPLPAGDYSDLRLVGPPVVGGLAPDQVNIPGVFPVATIYGGGYPTPGVHAGYAMSSCAVQTIETGTQIRAQITAEEPSLYDDDQQVRFRCAAVGGEVPYTMTVRLFDGDSSHVGSTQVTFNNPPVAMPATVYADDWANSAAPYPSLNNTPGDIPNMQAPHATNVPPLAVAPVTRNTSDKEEFVSFNVGSIVPGWYWAEMELSYWDGAVTHYSYAYTTLNIGSDVRPAGSSGSPPDINASINLRDLGENRKGFVANVSVDGGQGGYNYYWCITRPRFDVNNSFTGEEIVDASAPYVSSEWNQAIGPSAETVEMTSNRAQQEFEFHTFDLQNNITGATGSDGIPDANGIYFVHCYVMDRASSSPALAPSVVAHDVEMVTISDTGTAAGGTPSTYALARTPMAVLHAYPPGNASSPIGNNPAAAGGGDRPYIGSATTDEALEPSIAPAGDTIIIRGFNFSAPAAVPGNHRVGAVTDNVVTFAGGQTAAAIDVIESQPPTDLVVGGTTYRQLDMFVRVPDGAQTGYIAVTTPGGTSERTYFFQTGFNVYFDLIGKLSPNDDTYLLFELDYQGDGRIDYTYDTTANPSQNGQVLATDAGIYHDYAADGIGNYNATLYVTDLVWGRRQKSSQLIMIRDRNPLSQQATIISNGSMNVLSATNIEDPGADFLASGVVVGDVVENLTRATSSSVTAILNGTTLSVNDTSPGGTVWQNGDTYRIIRFSTSSTDADDVSSMLVNLWPEIDLRSETFTPDPNDGVMFHTRLGGVSTAGVRYKWMIDGGGTSGGLGGDLVYSGSVTGVPGGYNSPVLNDLDTILIDANANPPGFPQVGDLGVRVGDLVYNRVTGFGAATNANVRLVDSNTQITVVDPTDPTYNDGLRPAAGTVARGGLATADDPAGTTLWDTDNHAGFGYDFIGLDYGPGDGGIVAGDTVLNVTTGATATVTNVAVGQLTHTPLNGGTANTAGTAQAGSAANQLVVAVLPARVQVGDAVDNLTGGGSGTITAIAGNTLTTSIPLMWVPGDNYVIYSDGDNWVTGDQWRIILPRYQFRIGYLYDIYTDVGFDTNAWADADFADQNNEIDFTIEMNYPFDLDPALGNPTTVLIDWDGDNVVDETQSVGRTSRLDGEINALEIEYLRVSHGFSWDGGAGDLASDPVAVGRGVMTNAQYRVVATPYGQAFSNTYPSTAGWYQFPGVMVGGDEVDNSLSVLNVISWDRSSWHRVAVETSYTQISSLMSNPVAGITSNVLRRYSATDQMHVPPGLGDYGNTLTTWASYSNPFVIANNTRVTTLRHQAVHGYGGSLNWMSDANADTRWSPGYSESPLGDNPVNTYEFMVPNDQNRMSVPGAATIQGRAFPRALPGIGQVTVSGGFSYYQADRGNYTGYALTTDNLDESQRAFSFDTQNFFWGDRTGSAPAETRPLSADFYVEPMVTTSSQLVRFNGIATGGSSGTTYGYRWMLEKMSGPGGAGMIAIAEGPTGVFDPVADLEGTALDPGDATIGEGVYRVYLIVTPYTAGGPGATYTTCYREFEVFAQAMSISVMANPPSTTTGSTVQYHIFVEGGRGPYTIDADFDVNVNPGNEVTGYQLNGTETTLAHVFTESRVRTYDALGNITQNGYIAEISVTDNLGTTLSTDITPANPDVDVEVADVIPLNGSLLVTPPSGVAPFFVNVHYAVSGGRRFDDGNYQIIASLVNTSGESPSSAIRRSVNSFGTNGVLDDPRLPTADDEPFRFTVPEAGNYYVSLMVMDGEGQIVTLTDDVFASGYLSPVNMGNTDPDIKTDMEGRPLHAVRIWRDPFLSAYEANTDPATYDLTNAGGYENQQQIESNQTPRGGRLMEADLQILGDVFTTDPNPSFRSYGMYATEDPLDQSIYNVNYNAGNNGNNPVVDFYDTFTVGRVNLNTASEEALTAVFRKIIVERGYVFPNDTDARFGDYRDDVTGNEYVDLEMDYDGDGTVDQTLQLPYVRFPMDDIYMSEADARQLARDVVEYRTAYYDMYKDAPNTSDPSAFGYQRLATGDPELGNIRADHLPVIGPWDGVNPHEYPVDDRAAELRDAEDPYNAWDHIAAQYYSFDSGEVMFYSPTDVAVVREPLQINIGGLVINEPPSNYAKYLNDTVTNDFWSANRYDGDPVTGTELWDATGILPSNNNYYSRWAFDARNYFTYDMGTLDVSTMTLVGGESLENARNNMAVFESNDVTAYSYIPNPPFRNIYDLYKVIDPDRNPRTFELEASGGGAWIEIQDSSGEVEGTTISDRTNLFTNAQTYSGPSRFMYVAHWHDVVGEFIPVANYLDDIAPYLTCRSYVFRVEGSGAVSASGGSEGGVLDTTKISRDRSKTAIIDVGPLWSRKSMPSLNDATMSFGQVSGDEQASYRVLWFKDESY